MLPGTLPTPFTCSVKEGSVLTGYAESTLWSKIKRDKLLVIRDGGRTLIVINWPGEPPPREGRAPTLSEYLAERLANPQPPRVMPEGRHLGRPRKSPLPTDTGEPPPPPRRGRPRKDP